MAAPMTPKYSETASLAPAPGELTTGELAINYADKKYFVKDSGGSVIDITPTASVGDGSVTTTNLGGDITAAGKALLDDADAAAQRTTLGLGTAAVEAASAFAAASHAHSGADISSGTVDIARIPTGSSGTTVCIGNDSRLSDARTPTTHAHTSDDLTITTVSNVRSTNATITTGGGWQDVLSVSLTAGTWMVQAVVNLSTTSTTAGRSQIRISDGSSGHYASSEAYHTSLTNFQQCLTAVALITLGSTTTIRVQAACTGVNKTALAAIQNNGTGNNATQMVAVRVA